MAKALTQLTDKTFASGIAGSVPIIIDFWAAWCGPCRMLAPVFEELSRDSAFAGKLRFAKLDTEAYGDLASAQGITGIPCLIVYKNGEEVDRIIGFSPKPELKQKIETVLAKA